MKTILIIGGTKSFGKEFKILLQKEFQIVTIGRTNITENNNFICDVSDIKKFKIILFEIKKRFTIIDIVICVVGLATINKNDIEKILHSNFSYIQICFEILKENLLLSKNPKFITFDSRWSKELEFNDMFAYSIAKRALKNFILQIEKIFLKIDFFNIEVPPMKTYGLEIVLNSFKKYKKKFKIEKIFDYKEIAKKIISRLNL